jgi:hypothetical protein
MPGRLYLQHGPFTVEQRAVHVEDDAAALALAGTDRLLILRHDTSTPA